MRYVNILCIVVFSYKMGGMSSGKSLHPCPKQGAALSSPACADGGFPALGSIKEGTYIDGSDYRYHRPAAEREDHALQRPDEGERARERVRDEHRAGEHSGRAGAGRAPRTASGDIPPQKDDLHHG